MAYGCVEGEGCGEVRVLHIKSNLIADAAEAAPEQLSYMGLTAQGTHVTTLTVAQVVL